MLYSPECVEGEFCEVELPLYGVLRSSLHPSNHKQQQRYAVGGWSRTHNLGTVPPKSRQRPRSPQR